MKQRLLILILLLPLLVSAQNYPIVKDSAVWREVISHLINPPSQFGLIKNQYFIRGDTVINNLSYKKLYKTAYDSIISNPYYVGGMRETDSGRVYFLRDHNFYFDFAIGVLDSSEVLLYDYSLQQGDTFFLDAQGGWGYDSTLTVDFTDTILVDGTWRKRIVFNNGSFFGELRTWIEGIGSQKGLFFPYMFEFENWCQLVCYEDKFTHWVHPDSVYYCYTGNPIVGLEDRLPLKDQGQISIYPNPGSSILFIKTSLPINDIKEILIYDMHSRKLKQQAFNSFVEISDLLQGMYILELRLKDGGRVTKRFIKK